MPDSNIVSLVSTSSISIPNLTSQIIPVGANPDGTPNTTLGTYTSTNNCSITRSVAVDGLNTAVKFVEDNTNSAKIFSCPQNVPLNSGPLMLSFYAAPTSGNTRYVTARVSDFANSSNFAFGGWNVITGVAMFHTQLGIYSNCQVSISTDSFATGNTGNGWYKCSMSFIIGANNNLLLQIAPVPPSVTQIYQGDGVSGFQVSNITIN